MAAIELDGGHVAIVDARDSRWARRWKWRAKYDKRGRKVYATRKTHVGGKQVRLYLHKEILKRAGKLPPTPWHIIGEHKDGNSLNCRRANLEWFTRTQNVRTARRRPAPEDVQPEAYYCGDPT